MVSESRCGGQFFTDFFIKFPEAFGDMLIQVIAAFRKVSGVIEVVTRKSQEIVSFFIEVFLKSFF